MLPRYLRKLVGGKPQRTTRFLASAAPAPVRAEPERESTWSSPDPLPEVPCLDAPGSEELAAGENGLLDRVERRVLEGNLSLSQLPSTSMAIMDLAAKPTASVPEVVEQMEADPVLCSELLRAANSVSYGSRVATQSARDAVMRIGMRNLRTMILGLSMRSAMLSSKALQGYGEKVWRQAFTVASLARAIGPKFGIAADSAFLLGLLHDIGKVALLDTLSKELEGPPSPALVAKLFIDLHEQAGAEMARSWGLSDELISVAGCHHDFRANLEFPESAALVALAHRMNLLLSLNAAEDYESLVESDEVSVFGVFPEVAREALSIGRETFRALNPRPEAGPGAGIAA